MSADFSGKTVIISGAGRGLGQLAALEFAKAGANLALTEYDPQTLEDTLSKVQAAGASAIGIAGDIVDESVSEGLVKRAVEEFDGLDIAINNAGIAQNQMRLHETDSDLARRIVEVDLIGVFLAMKHQLPAMMERHAATGKGCSILNVASAAGVMGSPMIAAYAGAKHGVVGLTRSAAIEYASKGIRVNAICPAFTRTRMVTDILENSHHGYEKAESKLTMVNPMRRLGEPEEVVQAMLWASADENSFFNGQTLSIDGGLRSF